MDRSDLYRKTIKYLIMFLTVALTVKYIPNVQINKEDIIKLSCIAATTFVVLDLYSPCIKI